MGALTDEEAFALGARAVKAGMNPDFGIAMLTRSRANGVESFSFHGVVTDVGNDSVRVALGDDFEWNIWSRDLAPKMLTVPDLRDPGTKGHAVAQCGRGQGTTSFRPGATSERTKAATGGWIGTSATMNMADC